MRVTFVKDYCGPGEFHAVGATADFKDEKAQAFIDSGHAEIAPEVPAADDAEQGEGEQSPPPKKKGK